MRTQIKLESSGALGLAGLYCGSQVPWSCKPAVDYRTWAPVTLMSDVPGVQQSLHEFGKQGGLNCACISLSALQPRHRQPGGCDIRVRRQRSGGAGTHDCYRGSGEEAEHGVGAV